MANYLRIAETVINPNSYLLWKCGPSKIVLSTIITVFSCYQSRSTLKRGAFVGIDTVRCLASADQRPELMIWLLRRLWEEEGQAWSFLGLSTLADELDRILKSEPRCKELVSSHIAGIIGDVSIIGECLTQLHTYQPWAEGFRFAMEEHGDSVKGDFLERALRSLWVNTGTPSVET